MSEEASKKVKVSPAMKIADLQKELAEIQKELTEIKRQNVMWEIKFLEAHSAAAEARAMLLKVTHNV